jgi:hypothetical protein
MDAELEDLQNPEQWEDEGETRPGVKSPRAVVSVSFPRDELDCVSAEAQRKGMKLSEFIREAALARARPTPTAFTGVRSVSSQDVFSDYPQNRPRGTRTVSIGELIRS